jgi:hypothetical protein
MSAETARTVPTDYGYKWLLASWTVAKKHYADCMLAVLITIVTFVVLGRLGPFGNFIIAVCGPIWGAGCLLVTRTWLNGGAATVKDFFQVFQQPEKVKQLAPYLAFQVVLTLFSAGSLFFLNMGGLFYFPPLLVLIISLLTCFVMPLMVLTGMPFGKALSLSVNTVMQNIAPFAVCFGFSLVIAFIATLLLAIPLIFIVMPSVVVCAYIIYATVFENFDLSTILPVKNPPAQL